MKKGTWGQGDRFSSALSDNKALEHDKGFVRSGANELPRYIPSIRRVRPLRRRWNRYEQTIDLMRRFQTWIVVL